MLLLESGLKHAPDISIIKEDTYIHNIINKKYYVYKYPPSFDTFGSQWVIRQQDQLRPNFTQNLVRLNNLRVTMVFLKLREYNSVRLAKDVWIRNLP